MSLFRGHPGVPGSIPGGPQKGLRGGRRPHRTRRRRRSRRTPGRAGPAPAAGRRGRDRRVSTVILALAAGAVIGLALGALGGGGSVLAVPALIYLLGVTPVAATTASLVIVTLTCAAALTAHARDGHVRWREGLVFAAAGIGPALLGGALAGHLPAAVLTMSFAVVARRRRGPACSAPLGRAPARTAGRRRPSRPGRAAAAGAGLGGLTRCPRRRRRLPRGSPRWSASSVCGCARRWAPACSSSRSTRWPPWRCAPVPPTAWTGRSRGRSPVRRSSAPGTAGVCRRSCPGTPCGGPSPSSSLAVAGFMLLDVVGCDDRAPRTAPGQRQEQLLQARAHRLGVLAVLPAGFDVGHALLQAGGDDRESGAVQRPGGGGQLRDDVLAVPPLLDHPDHSGDLALRTP